MPPASSSNRLVFVSVKGKSTKRKVAIPVTPTTTFSEFVETVRAKLKLQAVGDMQLVSGEALTGLEQLEDIAEVLVREQVGAPLHALPNAATPSSPFSGPLSPRTSAAGDPDGRAASASHRVDVDDGTEPGARQFASKYIKKQSDVALAMKRMQSVFGGPGHESGSLPLTRKDTMQLTPIEQVKRRMKKRRRSVFDPRTLLALFSLLSIGVVLVFVYLRVYGTMVSEIRATETTRSGTGRKQLPGVID